MDPEFNIIVVNILCSFALGHGFALCIEEERSSVSHWNL